MEIVEEVVRRRDTIPLQSPEETYSEIRDLLERRMGFDHVKELKYFKNIDKGTVKTKLVTEKHYDQFTQANFEIHGVINTDSQELDIQVKAKIITHYSLGNNRKDPLWRYAYRTLYDKFLYGRVRKGFHEDVEEDLEELMTRIRQTTEVKKEDG